MLPWRSPDCGPPSRLPRRAVIGHVAAGHERSSKQRKHPLTPTGREHPAEPEPPVGLRPSCGPGSALRSHTDCRALLILIDALQFFAKSLSLPSRPCRVRPPRAEQRDARPWWPDGSVTDCSRPRLPLLAGYSSCLFWLRCSPSHRGVSETSRMRHHLMAVASWKAAFGRATHW